MKKNTMFSFASALLVLSSAAISAPCFAGKRNEEERQSFWQHGWLGDLTSGVRNACEFAKKETQKHAAKIAAVQIFKSGSELGSRFAQSAREYASDLALDVRAYAAGAQMEIAPLIERGHAVGINSLHWLLAADASDEQRSAMMALRIGGIALGAAAASYAAYKVYQACKSCEKEAASDSHKDTVSVAKQPYVMHKELARSIAQEALNTYFEKRSSRL